AFPRGGAARTRQRAGTRQPRRRARAARRRAMTDADALRGDDVLVSLAAVREDFAARRGEFAGAEPFPHLVVDGLLRPELAAAVAAEFDAIDDGWIYYHHVNERKRGFNDVARMGPASRAAIAALNAPEF